MVKECDNKVETASDFLDCGKEAERTSDLESARGNSAYLRT